MAGVKVQPPPAALPTTSEVQAFVHCDFSPAEPFAATLMRNINRSSAYVRGLQLNLLPWMEVDYQPLWVSIKQHYPNLTLVLQAHRHIMERYTPEQIAHRLESLHVDYILFDSSQSRGIAYDVTVMRSYVDVIYRKKLRQGVVVAGGLEGRSVEHLLLPLMEQYPALSCDAFGHLQHASGNRLSPSAVTRYLQACSKTIARTHTRGQR